MPYISRDVNKNITAYYKELQPKKAEEFIDDAKDEMVAFYQKSKIMIRISEGVTPLQARRALNEAGLRQAVESYFSKQSLDVQDAWNYASVIFPGDILVAAASKDLGISNDSLVALFKRAIEL